MNNKIEDIAPSGDLLIILKPSTKPFAPWGEQKRATTTPSQFKARVLLNVMRMTSPVLFLDLDPSGPWKKPEVQSDGLYHKHMEGFDPDALKHVLNVLHFRNNEVLQSPPVEALAKIAVIVDYLQCHEATAFVAQAWTRSYEESSTKGFTRPIALWLFVSIVFRNDRIFKQTAARAVIHCTAPFNTLGLPFPEKIVGKGRP